MTKIELIDAFLNSGLPQYANKVRSTNDTLAQFNEDDLKTIKNQIKDFDQYFKSGWLESKSRQTLINFLKLKEDF